MEGTYNVTETVVPHTKVWETTVPVIAAWCYFSVAVQWLTKKGRCNHWREGN